MSWSKDTSNTTTYLDFGVAPVTGTGARTTFIVFKTTTTHGALVYRMGGWGTASPGQRWGWRMDGSASYSLRFEIDSGYATGSTTTGLNDGNWHAAAFGVPASDDLTNAVMHIDGTSQSITSSTGTSVNTGSGGNLWLGVDGSSFANGIICEYAEIAIWNRLLDASERAAITGGILSPLNFPNGLVLYSDLTREFYEHMGLGSITENDGANASITAHPNIYDPEIYNISGMEIGAAAVSGNSNLLLMGVG